MGPFAPSFHSTCRPPAAGDWRAELQRGCVQGCTGLGPNNHQNVDLAQLILRSGFGLHPGTRGADVVRELELVFRFERLVSRFRDLVSTPGPWFYCSEDTASPALPLIT